MGENRKVRFVIICALCFSIITMSIAYATFSSMLEVNAETYLYKNNWSIAFDNLADAEISGNAIENNPPTITSTSISMDVSLNNVNDSIVYSFDVKNNGTLDAKLNAIPAISGIPTQYLNNISYNIEHADGTEILANERLNSGETKRMKITIKYLNSELDSSYVNFTINSIFLYVQA